MCDLITGVQFKSSVEAGLVRSRLEDCVRCRTLALQSGIYQMEHAQEKSGRYAEGCGIEFYEERLMEL